MKDSFHKLLRECRKQAGLTQKQLADMIHIHSSMISRFEKDLIPEPFRLHEIINAFALRDVPRDTLDNLWVSSGHYIPSVVEGTGTDPVVSFLQQELIKLEPEQRQILVQDIRNTIEIDQAYFSADKYRQIRQWRQATSAFYDLRKRLELRLQHIYLRVDSQLARCLYSDGHYADAIFHYQSALWSARQVNDKVMEAKILLGLGDAHRRRGGLDWDIADQRYSDAQSIFSQLGDHNQVTNCIRKRAGVYLFRGQPHEALPLIDECLSRATVENDHRGIYKALQHKAWAYLLLGRWDEATELCERALEIVRETSKDEWELIASYRYLADSYRINRDIEKARKTYEEALNIIMKYQERGVGVNLYLGMIHLGLGKVFLKMPGRELEAKECLNNSLEVHKGLGEDFRLADVLCEQGDLLLRLNRYEESEMRLNLAIALFDRLGNVFHYANAMALLCQYYYKKAEYERLFSCADAIRQKDNGLINYHLSRVEAIIGKAYIDRNEYDKAGNAFHKAICLSLNFNNRSFEEIVQEVMFETDRIVRRSDPEYALAFLTKIKQLLDTGKIDPQKFDLIKGLLTKLNQKINEIKGLEPIL